MLSLRDANKPPGAGSSTIIGVYNKVYSRSDFFFRPHVDVVFSAEFFSTSILESLVGPFYSLREFRSLRTGNIFFA